MKKLIVIFAVVMIGVSVSCGEKRAEDKSVSESAEVSTQRPVCYTEPIEIPYWFEDDTIIVKQNENSEKHIYFKLSIAAQTSIRARELVGSVLFSVFGKIFDENVYFMIENKRFKANFWYPISNIRIYNYFFSNSKDSFIPYGEIFLPIERINRDTGKMEDLCQLTLRYKMNFNYFVDNLMEAISLQAPTINEELKKLGERPLDLDKIRERLMQLGQ
jgi:hypothetical protein